MKVLIVCSGNSGKIGAFINDQAESLVRIGIEVSFFMVVGKGIIGYLKNYKHLIRHIRETNPQIIHAHYGLSGLLANLQRKIPVVVTYHGSDINLDLPLIISKFSIRLSAKNIFVSEKLAEKARVKNPEIIPCGVNLNTFKPIDKHEARIKMGLDSNMIYILFSSSFNNPVKNYSLAKQAIGLLKGFSIELLELKDYNRNEVALLLNAVDAAVMTSFTEGSPQFIKEAMACNTPIVTVDVGDVREIIGAASNCFISKDYNPADISSYLHEVILSRKRSNGSDFIKVFDETLIADKIVYVYNRLI